MFIEVTQVRLPGMVAAISASLSGRVAMHEAADGNDPAAETAEGSAPV